MHAFLRKLLRRASFPGQHRLFHYLFRKGYLKSSYVLASPINGSFLIHVNTKNLIDAQIVYLGDYEPEIKHVFKALIKPGSTVLDIGANIGFHSLYFNELAGKEGRVIAFEPVDSNYNALCSNIKLNGYENIYPLMTALSDKAEEFEIDTNPDDINSGSFNLFKRNNGNTPISCRIGDEVVSSLALNKVDFIKIDVEGYEYFVLKGLSRTLDTFRPKIIFEYDRNYQLRTNQDPKGIFDFLADKGYIFYSIDGYGLTKFCYKEWIQGADILAVAEINR